MCLHNTVTHARCGWGKSECVWVGMHGDWGAGTTPALFQVKFVLLFNIDEWTKYQFCPLFTLGHWITHFSIRHASEDTQRRLMMKWVLMHTVIARVQGSRFHRRWWPSNWEEGTHERVESAKYVGPLNMLHPADYSKRPCRCSDGMKFLDKGKIFRSEEIQINSCEVSLYPWLIF